MIYRNFPTWRVLHEKRTWLNLCVGILLATISQWKRYQADHEVAEWAVYDYIYTGLRFLRNRRCKFKNTSRKKYPYTMLAM